MEVGYRAALLARAPPDASESPRPDRAPSRPDGACSPMPRLLAGVQAGLGLLAAGLYESPGLAREAGTPLALAAMPEAMIAWHCREAGVAYILPGTPLYDQEGTGRPKATKHRRARLALLHKRLAAASLAAGAASGRPATPLEPHHTQCTHSALNAQSLVRTQCRVHSCSSCTECKVHKSAQKASVHSVLSAFGGPCFKRSAQCTKADQRSGRAKKSSKLVKSG